jgi:cytoskeleton protein RodZ
MYSVGETLRRARLEQGLDLAAVAARTKINAKFLEAIEADQRQSLPNSFFYRSFVEQYARDLSLDGKGLLAEVDRILSADQPLPLPGRDSAILKHVPPVTTGARFPRGRIYASAAMLLVVLAGCSAVYAWWHGVRATPRIWSRIQPQTAAAKAPPPPAPQAIAVALEPQAAPEPPPPPDSQVLVDLLAHEETWLSVSSDGRPVFSGLLKPNETKTVAGKQVAKMRVGNAAGLQVRLNGKLLGPLGARGQVLVVVFTPEGFQIFDPAKEGD